MRPVLLSALLAAWLGGLTGCSREDAPPGERAAAGGTQDEIAWFDGDVEAAFDEAEQRAKPVLLYWGAKWCPPCNQLSATVFKRPGFVAQTRNFIPVYLDGDSEGAQRWGEHFGIVGYPTLIVLRPDRTELTRIPGGLDLEQYPRVLELAQRQTRPVRDLLAKALDTPEELAQDDWTRLALYGWVVDQGRVLKADRKVAAMGRLAASAPASLRPRFELLALLARVEAASKPAAALPPTKRAGARQLLLSILSDDAQVKANLSELQGRGADAVRAAATPGSGDWNALSDALRGAMDRMYADASLTVMDRLFTAFPPLDLHRQEHPDAAVPADLGRRLRERARWADGAAKTPFERQAVIPYAADVLELAGFSGEAEEMLLAELERSKSPYYYMLSLADLAKKRKDTKAALGWLRRAWETSEGSATRAQWANYYVAGLVELRPADASEIEAVVTKMIAELAGSPDAYYQRTRQRLGDLGGKLRAWSAAHDGDAVLRRLQLRMGSVCASLPTGSEARRTCDAFPLAA